MTRIKRISNILILVLILSAQGFSQEGVEDEYEYEDEEYEDDEEYLEEEEEYEELEEDEEPEEEDLEEEEGLEEEEEVLEEGKLEEGETGNNAENLAADEENNDDELEEHDEAEMEEEGEEEGLEEYEEFEFEEFDEESEFEDEENAEEEILEDAKEDNKGKDKEEAEHLELGDDSNEQKSKDSKKDTDIKSTTKGKETSGDILKDEKEADDIDEQIDEKGDIATGKESVNDENGDVILKDVLSETKDGEAEAEDKFNLEEKGKEKSKVEASDDKEAEESNNKEKSKTDIESAAKDKDEDQPLEKKGSETQTDDGEANETLDKGSPKKKKKKLGKLSKLKMLRDKEITAAAAAAAAKEDHFEHDGAETTDQEEGVAQAIDESTLPSPKKEEETAKGESVSAEATTENDMFDFLEDIIQPEKEQPKAETQVASKDTAEKGEQKAKLPEGNTAETVDNTNKDIFPSTPGPASTDKVYEDTHKAQVGEQKVGVDSTDKVPIQSCSKENEEDYKESGHLMYAESDNGDEVVKEVSKKREGDTADEAGNAKVDQYDEELRKIQDLIHDKKTSHEAKMHILEMQLMKLENQLLMESLSKHNSTASFSKLENQILKLENELLRLDHSFALIQKENERLAMNQQTTSDELITFKESSEQNKQSDYPVDFRNDIMDVISSHQEKILELMSVIQGQSINLQSVEERSSALEKQNEELQKQLMGQTLSMSELLKKINEMSVEQLTQRRTMELALSAAQEAEKEANEAARQRKLDAEKNKVENPKSTKSSSSTARASTEETKKASTTSKSTKPSTKTASKLKDDEKVPTKSSKSTGTSSKKSTKTKTPSKGTVKPTDDTPSSKKPDAEKAKSSGDSGKSTKTKKSSKSTSSKTKSSSPPKATDSKSTKSTKAPTKTKTTKSTTSTGKDSNASEDQAANKANTVKTGEAKPKKTTKSSSKSSKTKTKAPTKSVEKDNEEKEADTPKNTVAAPKPLYLDPAYITTKDCFDLYLSGRKRDTAMKVRPKGARADIEVWCDMKNGGWTTILRRQDGRTDFFRDWREYKLGFGGGVYGEHWLGLDNIHLISNQDYYSLRVDLTDWDRETVTAEYENFLVEDETNGYRLHISGYHGNAGDGFLNHNGMKFSTKDVDNDLAETDFGGSCANRFTGAWWYHKCYKSNLTGKYYKGGDVLEGAFNGVSWKPWKGPKYSLKKVELKIRPKDAAERMVL